jgi:hypothetical protein
MLLRMYLQKIFFYIFLYQELCGSVADPGSLNKDPDPNSGFDDQCFFFNFLDQKCNKGPS